MQQTDLGPWQDDFSNSGILQPANGSSITLRRRAKKRFIPSLSTGLLRRRNENQGSCILHKQYVLPRIKISNTVDLSSGFRGKKSTHNKTLEKFKASTKPGYLESSFSKYCIPKPVVPRIHHLRLRSNIKHSEYFFT